MKKILNLDFLMAILSTLLGITYLCTGNAANEYVLGVLWLLIGGSNWWIWYNKNWRRY